MPTSRSSTPRHTTSPTNPSSTRTHTHDQPTSTARPSTADRSDSPRQTNTSIPYIEDIVPSTITQSRPKRRAASSPASDEQQMSKRFRRSSPSPRRRSRSSSESQGGMADTEEAEASQHSGRTPPPANPQKKKRTRTLTTPHQSAVLHALLAQSRFPTTAMREEVGRSIGLSARKVQIWFQNQRQKARRPRTQGDVQLTRPPQYGPYPTTGDSVPLAPAPSGSGASSSPQYTTFPHSGYPPAHGTHEYLPPPDSYYSSPVESGTQLLGPGMPGRGSSSRYRSPSPQRSPVEGRFRFVTSPRARPYPDPFARGGHSPPLRSADHDFSRAALDYNTTRGPGTGRPYVIRRTPSPSRTLPSPFPIHAPPASSSAPWELRPRLPPLRSSPSETEVVLSPIRHIVAEERITLPPILTGGGLEDAPLPSLETTHAEAASSRQADSPMPRSAGRYDPVRATVIPHRQDPTPPPSPPAKGT